MVEYILLFLVLMLAILGLSEVINGVKLYIYYPESVKKSYSLIVLEEEAPLEQLKYSAEQLKWSGKKHIKGIIAVHKMQSVSDDCKQLAKDSNIILCSPYQLAEKLWEDF